MGSKCLIAVRVNLAAVGPSSRPTRETLTQLLRKKLGRQDLQRSLALIQFIATVAGLEKRPLRFPGVGACLQLNVLEWFLGARVLKEGSFRFCLSMLFHSMPEALPEKETNRALPEVVTYVVCIYGVIEAVLCMTSLPNSLCASRCVFSCKVVPLKSMET